MYCQYCGSALSERAKFCKSCGKQQQNNLYGIQDTKVQVPLNLRGFSNKINDPLFKKYIRNSNKYALIFSIALAVIAIIGFTIAGEMDGTSMENPESLYIGLGVGGMFIVIALFQVIGRKRDRTWDGVVIDRTIKKKTERHDYGDGDYNYEDYLEYKVIIKSDQGKEYGIRVKDDDTMYNYYNIGDRVRHHSGLNSYEKYDKTGDRFIPCNACGTLCDINDDICFRCKCPLLK